jgi:hypothetical protein
VQPTLNVKQIRGLEFFNEYELDINNIKRKKNKVVDTLNERVHEMHVTAISMYLYNLKGRILGVTNLNQYYL